MSIVLSNIFLIKKRPIPEFFLFWGIVLMLIFGWVIQLFRPNLTTYIFEFLFLMVSSFFYLTKNSHTAKILTSLFVIIAYCLISFFYAVLYKDKNILDFIMIYKFTIYIALLLPFSNITLFDGLTLHKLMRLTLILFSLVYFLKFLLGNHRPTFFIENNFEIMFLCFLFFANHIINKRSENIYIFLLLFITIISGSRSGVILALITVLFCIDIKEIIKQKNIILPFSAIVGAFGAYFVFINRTEGGLEETDRYRFFQYFLDSIQDWTFVDYILGAERITKLPNYVCSNLAFYEKLLSFENNGTCYSVIFHSFNMRILFDHGIIVIFILFYFLNLILKNRTTKEKIFVFLLLIINGMSVSSINSIYAALGIAIIASLPNNQFNMKKVN